MMARKSFKMNPKGVEKKQVKANPKVIIYNVHATCDFAGLRLVVPLVQGQETSK